MFVLIDNYDSFTYNLWHYLGELGAEVEVYRNDAVSVDQVLALDPEGIVISPGPCDPDKTGICLNFIRACAGDVPLFGVCLGFQAIGQAYGAAVVRAAEPRHGKLSAVKHDNSAMFAQIPSPFDATRYHSLVLDQASLPDDLHVTAKSEDGLIMAIHHEKHSVSGVQFHPESIASEHGHRLLENFLTAAKSHYPGGKREAA